MATTHLNELHELMAIASLMEDKAKTLKNKCRMEIDKMTDVSTPVLAKGVDPKILAMALAGRQKTINKKQVR